MGWAIFYMFVVLKIPVVAAIWLVWWAAKQTPEDAPQAPGGGGAPRRDHPRPGPPKPPRRGPHADPAPQPPPRVRVHAGAPDRIHRA